MEFECALEIERDFLMAHYFAGGAYGADGQIDKAVRILERGVVLSDRNPFYLGFLGWAYGRARRFDDGREIRDELLERCKSEWLPSTFLAMVHSGLGAVEDGLTALEKAFADHETMVIWLRFPMFDALRTDPRFATLMRRMSLESGEA